MQLAVGTENAQETQRERATRRDGAELPLDEFRDAGVGIVGIFVLLEEGQQEGERAGGPEPSGASGRPRCRTVDWPAVGRRAVGDALIAASAKVALSVAAP